MYDMNFVSTVNRAFAFYPARLHEIFQHTRDAGTQFQKAYLCGLRDYAPELKETMDDTVLPEVTKPPMIQAGYGVSEPLPEFLKYNVYVTKVDWS